MIHCLYICFPFRTVGGYFSRMGLSGFFQALKAKGFDYEIADLSAIEDDAVVDIDMLGTPWFRNYLLRQLADQTSPHTAGIKLGALISSIFGPRTLRVHVDGARNQEKGTAQ